MTTTTPPGLAAAGLEARAVHTARAYSATDPHGFHRRHDSPEEWNRWARRARVTRTIATALQVPTDDVLVTDDPHRTYRTRTGEVPGDLITITDPLTGRAWRFIPDFTTPGEGWLLLDRCPDCEAEIPATRIATLADLGEYLDPDGDIWPADEARDEALHRPGCAFAVPTITTPGDQP
ncbi:hypothetical protein GCM10010174_28850 [Kutzneria viridogrisea]|uniref:Uncharacterized protein n=1 Tax=Kutzneria viridogrisea TaxID=47990 RepID=A0ABR6BJ22_9PSEU|nr:hypothetical protein [Kutzneria viridogrisea]